MPRRWPQTDERAQIAEAFNELVADGRDFASGTAQAYGDAEVDEVAAFLAEGADSQLLLAGCGVNFCTAFGHGSSDPAHAVAQRFLRATRGNVQVSYAQGAFYRVSGGKG